MGHPMVVFLLFALLLPCIVGGFAVVGYLPEWRYGGFDWERGCKLYTHLILFSVEPSPFGDVVGVDRMASAEVLEAARVARDSSGGSCKLLLCFGGNGRSSGFGAMSTNAKRRATFVKNVKAFLDRHGFDGVDYNWEYPGFAFGSGYKSQAVVLEEFTGLRDLVRETREALGADRPISVAFYPDGRQETLIKDLGIDQYVDLMHSMTYDQGGDHHSSYDWATKAMLQSMQILGPRSAKVTMGLPFYGRKRTTGDWVTYEDLCQRHQLPPDADYISDGGDVVSFNGIGTIERKTAFAIDAKVGGVMVWESGQDCRVNPVTREGKTHVTTCPKGEDSSLLRAVLRSIAKHASNKVEL